MSKQKVLAILAVVVVVVLVIVSISLGTNYNDAVAKLDAENAAKAELQLQLDDLTAQLTEVKTSLETTEALLAEETLAKEGAVKAAAELETKLTAELEAEGAKAATLSIEKSELEEALAAKITELETAAAQEEMLTAQIAELEAELSAKEQELATAKASLDSALAQAETDQKAIAELEETTASLTGEKNALEAEIALLNEKLAGYEAEDDAVESPDVTTSEGGTSFLAGMTDVELVEAESIGIALAQPEGATIEEEEKAYFGDTDKVLVTLADERVVKITCIDGILTVTWEGEADAAINEVISSIVVR